MSEPIAHAQPIDRFRSGAWTVMFLTDSGTMQVKNKDGLADAPYRAGDAVLVRSEDNSIICGPVGLQGAVDLAERIMEGDRVSTDPLALLSLATAVIAYSSGVTMPSDPAPAAPAASVSPTPERTANVI